ncbi:hypothetical protein DP186_24015, partial [Enterobacter hormaechei subsp. xiangfangensis]
QRGAGQIELVLVGGISIARYATRPPHASYHTFKKLAPGEWFNSVSVSRYIELYEHEILAKLNPEQTWNELHLLARCEPVLLCWEPPGEFCHRQLVARWFRKELGIAVDEYNPHATPQLDMF